MRIRLIEAWGLGRAGQELPDVAGGVAEELIRRGKAVAVTAPPEPEKEAEEEVSQDSTGPGESDADNVAEETQFKGNVDANGDGYSEIDTANCAPDHNKAMKRSKVKRKGAGSGQA